MSEVDNAQHDKMLSVFREARWAFAPWWVTLDVVDGRTVTMLTTQTVGASAPDRRGVQAQVHGLMKGWRWRCRRDGGPWVTDYAESREAALDAAEAWMKSWGCIGPDVLRERLRAVVT